MVSDGRVFRFLGKGHSSERVSAGVMGQRGTVAFPVGARGWVS